MVAKGTKHKAPTSREGRQLVHLVPEVILAMASGEQDELTIKSRLIEKGLPLDEHELDEVLLALEAEGMVKRLEERGRVVLLLPEAYPQLKRLFHLCDRAGRVQELMRTDWLRSRIDERLLKEMTKDQVFASIVTILRLLTTSHQEAEQDPFLSDLEAYLFQDEESYLSLGGISGALDDIGFMEFLQFNLSGVESDDLGIRRLEVLEQMADRDIEMFFGNGAPKLSVAEHFVSLLLPTEERSELFNILRCSPSALRIMLSARETRAGSFIAASTMQTLPLLERLFRMFADLDMRSCDGQMKGVAQEELASLVADRLMKMPRPSPLLKVLKGRMLADTSLDGQPR